MKQRNAGLDLIRTIAIVLVLVHHSSVLLLPHFNLLPFMKLPDGVDVFFVLSGFLIGRMIIHKINAEEKWNFKMTVDFIQRRWFRTLPNYFLFLLINIALVWLGITHGLLNKNTIAYFVFMQNLYKPLDLFFWESWSLSVEEWFYLLFPLFLFTIFYFNKNKKQNILIAITSFIIFPLAARFFMTPYFDMEWITWDLYFRKLVITRVDCIAIGVLGAFINIYYNKWWSKTKHITFAVGIFLLVILTNSKFSDISAFNKIYYFTLNEIAILMIFPLTICFVEEKTLLKPLGFISNASYSVYLLHLPLMYAFMKCWPSDSGVETIIRYTVYMITTFAISHCIFKYFEEPMKNVREKVSAWIVKKV